MKNILQHLKTSGIGTTSGMICFSGGQFLNTAITDWFLKTACLFVLMITAGIISKLVMEKVSASHKKED